MVDGTHVMEGCVTTMLTRLSVLIRGLLRWLKLTDWLDSVGKLFSLPSKDDFDRRVEDLLRSELKPGDVVWEIGANRGSLTRMLAGLVGRDGLVVAIEPEWTNMGHLASVIGTAPNVSLIDAALSDVDGSASLFVAKTDATGRAHSLAASRTYEHRAECVRTFRGDTLVRDRLAAAPNFLIIDVEGTEDIVLDGLTDTLRSHELRGVLIEIHFGILGRERRAFAPASIEKVLMSYEFDTRWLTRSHLVASRKAGQNKSGR